MKKLLYPRQVCLVSINFFPPQGASGPLLSQTPPWIPTALEGSQAPSMSLFKASGLNLALPYPYTHIGPLSTPLQSPDGTNRPSRTGSVLRCAFLHQQDSSLCFPQNTPFFIFLLDWGCSHPSEYPCFLSLSAFKTSYPSQIKLNTPSCRQPILINTQ